MWKVVLLGHFVGDNLVSESLSLFPELVRIICKSYLQYWDISKGRGLGIGLCSQNISLHFIQYSSLAFYWPCFPHSPKPTRTSQITNFYSAIRVEEGSFRLHSRVVIRSWGPNLFFSTFYFKIILNSHQSY